MRRDGVSARRFPFVLAGSSALLLLMAFIGLRSGAVPIPFDQVLQELSGREGIVFELRLPRILTAVLVGANMAAAGSILQGITRNPLAAPDIIGITAGGGLASAVMILTVPDFSPYMLPVAAFGGAALASICVYLLAYRGGLRTDRLALSGVAISAGVSALITFLVVKFSPAAGQALVWLKGSLYARSWMHVGMIFPWSLASLGVALLLYRELNLLRFQEDTAKGLGIRLEGSRLALLAASVGLAGSAVAVAGAVAFVGLVIPHLARLLVGSDIRRSLPVSAFLGAVLVLLADTLGRSLMPPLEVPAGIITSLIGAPYFLYLLLKKL